MPPNDLVKELASLNNNFISSKEVNFEVFNGFQGLRDEIAPCTDMTIYVNSTASNGGRTVSIRDRHNSFKVIQPSDLARAFYSPFSRIIRDDCITVIKVLYVDNYSLVRPFISPEPLENPGFMNVEKILEMEQNSPDFGIHQTDEQNAKIEALKCLMEKQNIVGACKDYVVIYASIPIEMLTSNNPYYVECLDLLIRNESYGGDGNTRSITADRRQHYIHPYSNKGANYIVDRKIENLRKNIAGLNVQIKSSKRINAENTAYHVQFDKIIEIPITDTHSIGDDGIYLTYQDPKSGTIDSKRLSIEEAHNVGIFTNLSEARGQKQQLDSKYRAEVIQRQEKERADNEKQAEMLRKAEEEAAKRFLEKVKVTAQIFTGAAAVIGAIYGLAKLFFGPAKAIMSAIIPLAFLAR